MPKSIIVADQYGYFDFSVHDIKKIHREFTDPEIFFTVSTDFASDYIKNNTKILHRLCDEWGFSHNDIEELVYAAENRRQRQTFQKLLKEIVIDHSPFEYFTPFFIRSDKSNKAFWFAHLSNHIRARDVIANVHWKCHNDTSHYGGPGIDMLGHSTRNTVSLPYLFDEEAEIRTNGAVQEQLPRALSFEGENSSRLLKRLINHTPATISMLENQLVDLRNKEEIEILSKSGKARKKTIRVRDDDIIRLASQRRLL
jgi:translation initiation factor IF-1